MSKSRTVQQNIVVTTYVLTCMLTPSQRRGRHISHSHYKKQHVIVDIPFCRHTDDLRASSAWPISPPTQHESARNSGVFMPGHKHDLLNIGCRAELTLAHKQTPSTYHATTAPISVQLTTSETLSKVDRRIQFVVVSVSERLC